MSQIPALESFKAEFEKYRKIGRRSLDQVSDEVLNRVLSDDNNSIAMVVRHISGNLISRFTNFLTTDGEKPWRNRDTEFFEVTYTRAEVDEMWERGWNLLESELSLLTDADLTKKVAIRDEEMSVHTALARSVAHTSYHVGQLVILARITVGADWEWLTIPKKPAADQSS